ncbi:MAG: M15 family metallopeptidase [Verrucomicrobiae bacterium]|nr:M15 family metallopeptidase [Verrucomicrobiae bacterium]NNJ87265.1 M15 family metallopeptidase [Akkermansiaceae bacterium]
MKTSNKDIFQQLGMSEDHFDQRGLPRYEDAAELVTVQQDENGRVHELIPEACEAWHAMKDAARSEGLEIFIVSAFRSVSRQAEIVQGKYESGLSNDEIFAVSAPPGFSEHHTGRAIDVSTPGYAVLEEEFEGSEAFAWLHENAAKFGFTMTYPRDNEFGFIYEPWHWAYTLT